MTNNKRSGGIRLANVTPLYITQRESFYGRANAAYETSVRLLHSAAVLPEGGFIGLQIETETLSAFAFSDANASVSEDDLGWIFDKCSEASSCQTDIKEDLYAGGRKVYALSSLKGSGSDLKEPRRSADSLRGDGYESIPPCGSLAEMLQMMKDANAVIRVCAGQRADAEAEHGTVLISLPREITLRMKSMLSITFPHTEAIEVIAPDRGVYLPDVMFVDSVSKILSALVGLQREISGNDTDDSEEDPYDFFAEDGPDPSPNEEQLTPIDELDLSARTRFSLKSNGIESVERLCELTDAELLNFRSFNAKCLEEVREKLAEYKSRTENKPVPESTNYAEMLDGLIGLDEVKEQINKFTAFAKMKKTLLDSGKGELPLTMNMEFVGNPGTGKTTVARIVAGILYEIGLLPSCDMIEASRADIVARYVGHTAVRVKELFQRAKGKLLFIDEAYSLVDCRENDFGDEAIHAIVQEMENNRKDTAVIFAGYPDKMKDFFSRNPGLRSRVPFSICFSDFSAEEMTRIVELEAKKRGFVISGDAREKVVSICAKALASDNTGNGRFCRNLAENAVLCCAARLFGEGKEPADPDCTLEAEDFVFPGGDGDGEKSHIGFCA